MHSQDLHEDDNTIDKIVLNVYLKKGMEDSERQRQLNKNKKFLKEPQHYHNHEASLLNFMNYSFRDQIFNQSEVEKIRGIQVGNFRQKLTGMVGLTVTYLYVRQNQIKSNKVMHFSFRKGFAWNLFGFNMILSIFINRITDYRILMQLQPIKEKYSHETVNEMFISQFDTEWEYSISKYNHLYEKEFRIE